MTLLGYVSRLFIARFAFCLVGLAALLQLLDLLDNATEALGRGGPAALCRYAMLRLPSIINQVVPVSVLLGVLISFVALAKGNEIVAMRSSGLSLYRIVALLLPATVVVALIHFAIGDQVAPRAERRFQNWWAATTPRDRAGAPNDALSTPLWIRDARALVLIERVSEKGRRIEGVRIFERDETSNLSDRIVAARAEYGNGAWTLFDVHRTTLGENGLSPESSSRRLDWNTSLTPANLAELAAPTETLSVRELLEIVAGKRPASAGHAFYQTRLQQKFALPLASLVMLLVAAPSAVGMRRHGNLSRWLGWGLAAGFLFFIADGLAVAAGQAGLLPATLAAWIPVLLFASIGGTMLIWIEDKG